ASNASRSACASRAATASTMAVPASCAASRPSRRPVAGLASSQRPSRSRMAMAHADDANARRETASPTVWLELPALDIARSCVLWGRYQGRIMAGCRQCERDRRQNARMGLDQILFLLILAGGLYLFVSERVRIDVSAMLILLALVVTGVLDSEQALSGFASEPAIIVAAVFVISGALAATGITEHIGQWIGRAAGKSEARAIAVTDRKSV